MGTGFKNGALNVDDIETSLHNLGINGQYLVSAQIPPDMTVRVSAATRYTGNTFSIDPPKTSSGITAPAAEPRIDRVVLNPITGDVDIVTGTEDPTPVPPAVPPSEVPLAQINLLPSTTEITDDLIENEQPAIFNPARMGNLNIDGSTISALLTNGSININPDGTGRVNLGGTNFRYISQTKNVTTSDQVIPGTTNRGAYLVLARKSGFEAPAAAFVAIATHNTSHTIVTLASKDGVGGQAGNQFILSGSAANGINIRLSVSGGDSTIIVIGAAFN